MAADCVKAQMLFVFHSTLHSSQSSRVRFVSHPAASTPGIYISKNSMSKIVSISIAKQIMLVKNKQDKVGDSYVKTVLCVLTFDKWNEHCVHQLMTLMHNFPVT